MCSKYLQMKQNALLIIDPQNSFCNPGENDGLGKGSLYVEGAEKDMERLAAWIRLNIKNIDYIGVTLDLHQPNDIAHPNFWQDKNGNPPAPFTSISATEVEKKIWTARFRPEKCLKYIKELEEQGEYPHIIWPVHCVVGSEGAAIYKPLMQAIEEWTQSGKFFHTVNKGLYPFSEHFGAFHAQIPSDDYPETQLNKELLNTLGEYKNIYISGQAKSHCVANSLKQLLKAAPQLATKIIILEDTMSNVTGFENLATPIYDNAKKMGVRFSTTDKEKVIGK